MRCRGGRTPSLNAKPAENEDIPADAAPYNSGIRSNWAGAARSDAQAQSTV